MERTSLGCRAKKKEVFLRNFTMIAEKKKS